MSSLVGKVRNSIRRRARLSLDGEIYIRDRDLTGVKRMHQKGDDPDSGRTPHGALTVRRRRRANELAKATRRGQRAAAATKRRLRQKRHRRAA